MYELIIKRKKKENRNFILENNKFSQNIIKNFTVVLDKNIILNERDILCCINYKNNIIVGTEDRDIKIYNVYENKLYSISNAHNGAIYSLIILNDKLLSCSSDRTIKVWDIQKKELLITFLGHESHVYGLHKITENLFISFSLDKTIKIWDLSLRKIIKVIRTNENSPMCVNNTKEFIFAGLGNGNINIYELKTGKIIKELNAHSDTVNSITIFNKYFFSAGRDKQIKVWNNNFELEKEFIAHKSVIWKIIIDGNRLISISDDKTIKLWDIITFNNLDTLQIHYDWISDICNDNKNIYTSSGDGSISILNKKPYYDCSKINLEKENIEKSPFESNDEYNNRINVIQKEFEKRLIDYEYINVGNIQLIFDEYNLETQILKVNSIITCEKIIKKYQLKRTFINKIKVNPEIAKELYNDNKLLELYVRFFSSKEYKFYMIFKSNLFELDYNNQIEEEKSLSIKTARLQIKSLKPNQDSKILDLDVKDGNLLSLSDTFKNPFETYEEFIERMKKKFIKNEIYSIGKVELLAKDYSIENKSFPFFASITAEKILNIIECPKNFHGQIFIDKNKAKSLFENSKFQNLYIQFIDNNQNISFYLFILFNNQLFYVF
jgi:WD40 repeat protein